MVLDVVGSNPTSRPSESNFGATSLRPTLAHLSVYKFAPGMNGLSIQRDTGREEILNGRWLDSASWEAVLQKCGGGSFGGARLGNWFYHFF